MSHEEEENAHSERGPSTAHRWRRCKASVQASRGLPDEAGIEAAYGTVFHDFAADCLELGLDPQGFVGDSMIVPGHGRIKFDQAMADNMLNGLDWLWAAADVPGAKMIVEERVSLEEWVGPGEFGTTDAAIIDPLHNRLIVFDWKYGQGVPVTPERNDQAMLYALGTWSSFARQMFWDWHEGQHEDWGALESGVPWEDDIEVIIVIEQPRAPGGGGDWTISMGELLAEGRRIRRDADETMLPNPPFNPGPKQCQFCKAAKFNTCEARARMLVEEVGADFDSLEDDFNLMAPVELHDKRALSPKARSQLILHAAQIKKFLDEIEAEARNDAEKGRPVPGMKLVPGRSPARKWKSEAKAKVMLEHDFGEKAYSKKLLSPAQVEEETGKRVYQQRFRSLVDYGEAKPILVPETDKRDPLPDVTSDFDGLVDDEESLI